MFTAQISQTSSGEVCSKCPFRLEGSLDFLSSKFHFRIGMWLLWWYSTWYHDDSLLYELMCLFEMNPFQNASVAYAYHDSITLAWLYLTTSSQLHKAHLFTNRSLETGLG